MFKKLFDDLYPICLPAFLHEKKNVLAAAVAVQVSFALSSGNEIAAYLKPILPNFRQGGSRIRIKAFARLDSNKGSGNFLSVKTWVIFDNC